MVVGDKRWLMSLDGDTTYAITLGYIQLYNRFNISESLWSIPRSLECLVCL